MTNTRNSGTTTLTTGMTTRTATTAMTKAAVSTNIMQTLMEVCKLGFRAAMLIPNEPKLWFTQCEQNLANTGITTETTKFSYLGGNIDRKHAIFVKVNFYLDLLPHAARMQAAMNELLKGNIKGNQPISWLPLMLPRRPRPTSSEPYNSK
ncbi:hypothetical protein TSAR_015842 [Trichomalopsis sarcophagae]|uniref:DUF7041 domain-containing protein n=1 Tax=Trichomalopsis sarcophagae TaxID=543379 RepID=A0A232EPH5_9HYME|nr:hypothetical protein TSAR_015842 [Trichomalopsis sarcophagae]